MSTAHVAGVALGRHGTDRWTLELNESTQVFLRRGAGVDSSLAQRAAMLPKLAAAPEEADR